MRSVAPDDGPAVTAVGGRIRVFLLLDRDRRGGCWPALAAPLAGVFDVVDLEWRDERPGHPEVLRATGDTSPHLVLATGGAAWSGYRLSLGDLNDSYRLVLVDPEPPGAVPEGEGTNVALTVIGTAGWSPTDVARLLAWRPYAGAGFEVRFLPARTGPAAAALFASHLVDSLGLWWTETGHPSRP